MPSSSTREAYLRLPAVISATGLSKATIYRRIKAGEFPDAYSLGGHSVAWKRSELEDWMESRSPRAKPG